MNRPSPRVSFAAKAARTVSFRHHGPPLLNQMILAGTVYVAVAAAAFAQGHWSYAALLWALTFFAVARSLTVAILARGARQAAAVGFAIGSVSLALCLHAAEDASPLASLASVLFSQTAPLPTTPGRPMSGYGGSSNGAPPPQVTWQAYPAIAPQAAQLAVVAPVAAPPLALFVPRSFRRQGSRA